MSNSHDDEVKSISERSSQSGSGSEGESGSGSEEEEEDGSEVNIDLSNNEFYKGMCTLLEDDNGNNIVQYVDLLCDNTAAISENTKHLEQIRNDIHRIAKTFERMVSLQEQMIQHQMGGGSQSVMPPVPPTKREHSHGDEGTVKSSKKSSSNDDGTVKTSKSHSTHKTKH
jgi:hypothetical protein